MRKAILILFLLSFLLSGLVSAAPQSPYSVAGVVKADGTTLEAASVKVENTNKQTVDYVYTNQYGEYFKDLTIMSNGVSHNDNIKITSCIGDTRCYEKTEQATADNPNFNSLLRIDVNALVKSPSGIGIPFNIIGKVKIDGNYIASENVELINQRTQNSKTVKTDLEGFYSFNLANFNDIYRTGDKIDIKVRWYTLTITVLANVPAMNADIDISSTEPSSSSDGGSSDSGGGGSTYKKPGTETKPAIIVDHDISELVNGALPEATFSLTEGSSTTFTIDGITSHKLTILKLTSGSATIQIESEPVIITLLIGESRKLDLDLNGKYDTEVILNSIIDKKAEITVRKLQADEPALPEQEEGTETTPIEPTKPIGTSGIIWIVLVVIIAIIGVGIYFWKKKVN